MSTADVENAADRVEYSGSGPVAGGTIMGIHNLAIVFPQFIVSRRSFVCQSRRTKRSTVDRRGGFDHLQGCRWRCGGIDR